MNKYQTPILTVGITAMMLLIMLIATTAAVEPPTIWSDLKPGPYAVGFETVETWDNTRTIRPGTDYFGNVLEGNRHRMIQTCLWYPATPSDLPTFYYGEYNFPSPDDVDFFGYVSEMQNKDLRMLGAMMQPAGADIADALNVPVFAARDIPVVEGKFPLVLYLADNDGSYSENSVLCEYLASNGFVVAAIHPAGLSTAAPAETAFDIETRVYDVQLALATIKNKPYVNSNQCGLIGHGTGATVALLLQMRDYDIDAVVCLNPDFIYSSGQPLLKENPFYSPARMKAPLISFFRADAENLAADLFEEIRYSTRYLMGQNDLTNMSFSSHVNIAATAMKITDSAQTKSHFKTYKSLCIRSLVFLQKYVAENNDVVLLPVEPPNTTPADGPILVRFDAEEAPPTQEEFVQIIRSRGGQTAIEIYDKFRLSNSSLVLFDENRMNMLGYQYFQQREMEIAAGLFRMNAETYPESANCWDSYSEALVAIGNTEEAIKAVKQVLATVDSDPRLNDALRETLRTTAQARLKELGTE